MSSFFLHWNSAIRSIILIMVIKWLSWYFLTQMISHTVTFHIYLRFISLDFSLNLFFHFNCFILFKLTLKWWTNADCNTRSHILRNLWITRIVGGVCNNLRWIFPQTKLSSWDNWPFEWILSCQSKMHFFLLF